MIYIDELRPCLKNEKWKYDKSCHLFGDTVGELKLFALSIGLKLSWFQDSRRFPHFDLTEGMQIKATVNGAKCVDRRFVVNFIKKEKETTEILENGIGFLGTIDLP